MSNPASGDDQHKSLEPFGLAAQLSATSRVVNLGRPKRRSSQFKGAYRASSVTAEVAAFLRSERVFRRRCEIREAVSGSHAAVSWALLFLRAIGAVEVVPDGARNARYYRYRAKPCKNSEE